MKKSSRLNTRNVRNADRCFENIFFSLKKHDFHVVFEYDKNNKKYAKIANIRNL